MDHIIITNYEIQDGGDSPKGERQTEHLRCNCRRQL
jgi:hypothetical protein